MAEREKFYVALCYFHCPVQAIDQYLLTQFYSTVTICCYNTRIKISVPNTFHPQLSP